MSAYNHTTRGFNLVVRFRPLTMPITGRRKKQSAWALQSYMGMAYESYSTVPGSSSMKEESTNQEEQPEGWSGDVNTNIQVSRRVWDVG